MQRIFKRGIIQNISLTPDKEPEHFDITPSYVIKCRTYTLKNGPVFGAPCILHYIQ